MGESWQLGDDFRRTHRCKLQQLKNIVQMLAEGSADNDRCACVVGGPRPKLRSRHEKQPSIFRPCFRGFLSPSATRTTSCPGYLTCALFIKMLYSDLASLLKTEGTSYPWTYTLCAKTMMRISGIKKPAARLVSARVPRPNLKAMMTPRMMLMTRLTAMSTTKNSR